MYYFILILLLLTSLPPANQLIGVHVFDFLGMKFYIFDLLSGIVFIRFLMDGFDGKRGKNIFYQSKHIFYIVAIVGCIPLFYGFLKGKEDVLYYYRFFFYSLWAPYFYSHLSRSRKKTIVSLKIVLGMNGLSLLFCLILHFLTHGFSINYLGISYDWNVYCFFIVISCFILRYSISHAKWITLSLLVIGVCSFIFDPTRRVYIALGSALILLFFTKRKFLNFSKTTYHLSLIGALSLIILFTNYDLHVHIFSRFGNLARVQVARGYSYMTGAQILDEIADASVARRYLAMWESIQLIKDHPIVGIGTGKRTEWLDRYDAIGSVLNLSFYKIGGRNPHAFYFQMYMLFGIPIGTLIIYLIYKNTMHWSRLGDLLVKSGAKQPAFSIYGILFAMICYLIYLVVNSFGLQSFLTLWILLGMTGGFIQNTFLNHYPNEIPRIAKQKSLLTL